MNSRKYNTFALFISLVFAISCGNSSDDNEETSTSSTTTASQTKNYSNPYMKTGSTLNFDIQGSSKTAEVSASGPSSSSRYDNKYDFTFTEVREWDNRKRTYGVKNENVYLLKSRGKIDGSTRTLDFYDMFDDGYIKEVPLLVSNTNFGTQRITISDKHPEESLRGVKITVRRANSGSNNKHSILSISNGSENYSSEYYFDSNGVSRIVEDANNSNFSATRISSGSLSKSSTFPISSRRKVVVIK